MSDHNLKTNHNILMRLVGLALLTASIIVAILLLPIINNELIKLIFGFATVGGGVAGFMQLITGENYIKEFYEKNNK